MRETGEYLIFVDRRQGVRDSPKGKCGSNGLRGTRGNIGWTYVKLWEWIHSAEPNTSSNSCDTESGGYSDILHDTE
jgi:hypothetical protein